MTVANFDAKEQIKRAVDIVDLIGDYLQLHRSGRGYKALCPWHNDSRPSLQVNPERQSWKCWVCNVGGDIFSFVEKQEGVEFREALRLLADRAGIQLAAARGATSNPQAADEKEQLYRACAWAEQVFHDCLLKSPEAEPARKYLADRSIDGQSIARFKLGYAPDQWEWLVEKARGTQHQLTALEKAGLIGKRQSGYGYYDRFKGRVLFSIRDVRGRAVGIGGRVLPGAPADTAKYLNSPETPLFSKSQLLYGLDVAQQGIAGDRTIIVMEGYTDCLIAHQFGFTNATAVLGTALTERHVPLLRRFADRVVLMLDGDDAGQRRTNEILSLFISEQIDLQILTLPDGLDPCDFLLQRGAAAFREQLQTNLVDALEHKFRTATAQLTAGSSIHRAQQAAEDVLATLAKSSRTQSGAASAAKLKEDQILNRLARRSGVAEESLRARLKELRRTAKRPMPATNDAITEPAAGETLAAPSASERALLELLVRRPEALAEIRGQIGPDHLQSGVARTIFERCCDLLEQGDEANFARLMLEFDDPWVKNLLVEIDEEAAAKEGKDAAVSLADVLDCFRRQRQAEQIQLARSALEGKRVDESQELSLLQRILEQQRDNAARQRP